MTALPPDRLIGQLRDLPVLSGAVMESLERQARDGTLDSMAATRDLVQGGHLTLLQGRKLLADRMAELRVGRYWIMERLGEGAMGAVYLAHQAGLGRRVALKLLRDSLAESRVARRRFVREARAAGCLQHEHVVSVFDADSDRGRYYLAMEYVPGTDLGALVQERGPLPVEVAAAYVRQAALGLHHAHQHGLVHRDIKPSNLITSTRVAPPGPGFRHPPAVKILDMGLARLDPAAPADTSASQITQSGTVLGTPDFMSPEQARDSSRVDGRSDLYGLGCTWFWLLTKRPVFPGGGTLEKLIQHRLDPPPDVRTIRPEVPEWLAKLLLTLLAKEPSGRPSSGAELAALLDPHRAETLPEVEPMPAEWEETAEEKPQHRRRGRRLSG